MKKLILISLVLLSCKKKDDQPIPVAPTPAPVINHYSAQVSARSVKHNVYVGEPSPRDSSYFTLRVNSREHFDKARYTNSPSNIVLIDSVKTGDTLTMTVLIKSYEETFRDKPTEAYFRLNKAWLMKDSVETVLAEGLTDTIPIIYTDSLGTASRSWQFIIH